MDELRDGIWAVGTASASAGEYKLRAFEAFNGMLERMRQDIVESSEMQIRERIEEEVESRKGKSARRSSVREAGSTGATASTGQA